MLLDEADSKSLLRRYGIPTPRGVVAALSEVASAASSVGFPAVVKALIPLVGRGKLGAVRVVRSEGEARAAAEEMASRFSPRAFLVEEYVEHEAEYYLSVSLSRRDRCYVLLASPAGGVEVEELAKVSPPVSIKIDPLTGLKKFHALYAAKKVGLSGAAAEQFCRIALALYEGLVVGEDALLAEINPLAESGGELIALDAKVVLDDNASFRHDYSAYAAPGVLEEFASRHGLSFVKLSGDVAVVGNGAGLVLATMDLVKLMDGEPACFIDVGGGASPERVAAALKLASRLPGVKSIFVNIFGGITRCDEVASGIVSSLRELGPLKLSVRLVGTNEEVGAEVLRRAGIEPLADMEEAARRAVELARGG